MTKLSLDNVVKVAKRLIIKLRTKSSIGRTDMRIEELEDSLCVEVMTPRIEVSILVPYMEAEELETEEPDYKRIIEQLSKKGL